MPEAPITPVEPDSGSYSGPCPGLNFQPLEATRLRAALQTREADSAASDLHLLADTSSTNDEATRLARSGSPERTVVFAESQTAGRGRRGNTWNAPAGRDLLFSLVLYPASDTAKTQAENAQHNERMLRLPHLIAVAICQAIEAVLPEVKTQLKWPNDVYVKGKKLAGILVENGSASGRLFSIAGIGINVNSRNTDRPAELQNTATSLYEESKSPIDRHELVAAFLASFDQLYPLGLHNFKPILTELNARSLLLGNKISVLLEGRKIVGTVIGFADNGGLIIETTETHGKEQRTLLSADRVRLQ